MNAAMPDGRQETPPWERHSSIDKLWEREECMTQLWLLIETLKVGLQVIDGSREGRQTIGGTLLFEFVIRLVEHTVNGRLLLSMCYEGPLGGCRRQATDGGDAFDERSKIKKPCNCGNSGMHECTTGSPKATE
eukprot:Gb_02910 [translate_table: standard]